MILFKNINGETYNEQELIGYAEEEGVTLEQYMQDKTFEMVEDEETAVTTVDPTAASDTDLQPDDSSLSRRKTKIIRSSFFY